MRFGTTLLGSRAVAGTFERRCSTPTDADGISDARRARELRPRSGAHRRRRAQAGDVLAYAELHIEQGPVLEAEACPSAWSPPSTAATASSSTIAGMAGHAGTVPMDLRRDALAAAAECVLAVERGRAARAASSSAPSARIEATPGAINVIPGQVRFTLDVRAPTDAARIEAVTPMRASVRGDRARRGVTSTIEPLWEASTAPCAPRLQQQIASARSPPKACRCTRLPSGAGHDGMAIIAHRRRSACCSCAARAASATIRRRRSMSPTSMTARVCCCGSSRTSCRRRTARR